MIEHVLRRAEAVPELDRVVVLTDDERIAEAVEACGGTVEMTPETCRSGTDRIAWAAHGWREDAVVNIQGDEPLVDPGALSRLARHLREHPDDPMVTLAAPAPPDALQDPGRVKVVIDRRGRALYFSRAGIPYPRSGEGAGPLHHVGVYGYRREALLELAALPPSPLELAESLEQLRALENGIPIRVLVVPEAWPGVDTMDDLKRAEEHLAR